MKSIALLKKSWEVIEGIALLSNGREPLTIWVDKELDQIVPGMRVAVDVNANRHLLIPLEDGIDPQEDCSNRRVQICVRTLDGEDETPYRYLDIACGNPQLHELFLTIADDMVAELKLDSSRPDLTCTRVLDHRRDVLDSFKPTYTDEQAADLFTNLWHLDRLISIDPHAIWAWLGTLRAPQDFGYSEVELIVKTTLQPNSWMLTINRHDELEPQEGHSLYLSALNLDSVDSGGQSSSSLIDVILSKGVDRGRLHCLMAAGGFVIQDLPAARFKVKENRVYVVDDEFRKLVGSKPSSGNTGVDYTIDVTAQPPVPISENEVSLLYRRLASH